MKRTAVGEIRLIVHVDGETQVSAGPTCTARSISLHFIFITS